VLMRNFATVFVLLTLCGARSFAWGPEGHRVIAEIARSHLSPAATLQVRMLLGDDDLAAVASWADEIKSERPETAAWHFVDIPRDASGFSEPRDCYRPDVRHPFSEEDRHNCVVDRIGLFQRVLADKGASREKRIEALKFLVHFVGDIHQPLHAIGEARGGNDNHVVAFGSTECGSRPCNLHFVWDIGLIEHSDRSERKCFARLQRIVSSGNLWRQSEGTQESWANESFQLARKVWLTNGGAVDDAYFRTNISIVDRRLALAGVRLAKMLNQIFAGQSS
jgi:S1/P1 Nuclease